MSEEREKVSTNTDIGPLKEEDITTLRSIGLNIPEFSVGTETPSFYSEEALRRMSQSPDCIVLVAKVKDEIAGFILTSLLVPARDAYIHTVAVTEKYRKQGLAGELLERTLSEIKSRQPEVNHVFTDIQTENGPSLSLFKKYGFEIGREFHYVDMMLPEEK